MSNAPQKQAGRRKRIHGKNTLRLTSPMYPATSSRREPKRDARKQLPVRTSRHTDDGHHVCAIMLDELDARILFLPQLEMAIDGRRNDKIRAVFTLRSNGGEP